MGFRNAERVGIPMPVLLEVFWFKFVEVGNMLGVNLYLSLPSSSIKKQLKNALKNVGNAR
jgi:hypothetical protein